MNAYHEVRIDGKLYAIVHNLDTFEEGRVWYGEASQPIQSARFCFNAGQKFRPHRHIHRPREITHTQEAMVVVKGCLRAVVYDDDGKELGTFDVHEGGIVVTYAGYHAYEVIADCTAFYEIKVGPFVSVEADKVFLGESHASH